ncbi:ammonium transporter [Aliikangiella coralliicola]|uniref:Ammonium transporter n=1 Tax=Aliikangiella coralliicola TaxID=2592383 RepID=A0A545UDY2_9GAMM|nr:ammonium transporter [Aliikangiella coralliicola]TQV87679.1 ammonium transporter [Aliikangiella coralliicola]
MESTDLLSQTNYLFNTLFLLFSGALVMWMAAGFAMLEAGLVRSKNTTEILTKNILLYALACIMYQIIGFDIMYQDNDTAGFFPSIGFGINETAEGASQPGKVDFFFQVVFVATAMSIVSGAVAERMKLSSFLLFAVFLTAFIYPLEGYWTWGAGFLGASTEDGGLGFSDFAGSAIVHMAGAMAALAGVILLGPRKGRYSEKGVKPVPGANMPLVALGTFILWFGWLGFNGGSQLSFTGVADADAVANIFVNTNAAAAAGALLAYLLSLFIYGKADLTLIVNGALAGLVTITAAPDSPTASQAAMFGALGATCTFFAIKFFDQIKIDDPVGAISVHGVAGIVGVLLVPVTKDVSVLTQLAGLGVIAAWVFSASLLIWYLLKKTVGIRISSQDEYIGADISECGLEAYPEFISGRTSNML